jgi:ketosteroid isomerase-like protein
MSVCRDRNVELHRCWTEAFNTRDVEAVVASCDPSIEFHSSFAAVGGGVYHGHDGMRGYFRDLEETWGDEIRVEPEAYFDLGQHVLAFYVVHGRGRHSGVEVAMPIAYAYRWRDGLMVYLKGYVHKEDALRDLGVSEDQLEPIDP